MSRDPVRFGLVGAGPWAQLFTAPMLAAGVESTLSAVYARRPTAAAAVADVYGARAVPSFDEILAECDAVAFAVPPDVQAELAPRAAAAGKHLLLEKPLGFTMAQASSLAEAVDGAGVVAQLLLTTRFTAAARTFLNAVHDGRDIRAITADFVSGATLPGALFETPWRHDNVLLDLGPHVLDLLDAVGGPVRTVTGQERNGCVGVALEHESGVISQAMLSTTVADTHGPMRCTALTDQGRVVLGDISRQPLDEIRHAVIDAFTDSVARGASDLAFDVRRGVLLQRLLTAVRSSIESARPVTVLA